MRYIAIYACGLIDTEEEDDGNDHMLLKRVNNWRIKSRASKQCMTFSQSTSVSIPEMCLCGIDG